MLDDNWDLITGDAAHEIEVLNHSNQVNVIEALVRFIIHHYPIVDANGCTNYPTETALRELHRTGTLFLLREPGQYRRSGVHVVNEEGHTIHEPPSHDDVASHMAAMFSELAVMWPSSTPVDVGAYVLWRVNWVHPFKNGNGRTARAFCYACICLKFGFILPGTSTLIDLVMQNRSQYQHALKAADNGFVAQGAPDLSIMRAFVERLLREQLMSIPGGV